MARPFTAVVVPLAALTLAPVAHAALTFTGRVTFDSAGNSAREFVLADLNGDGLDDAATVTNVGTVRLKRNTTPVGAQAPTFDAANVSVNVGTSPEQVAAGDVNGDGTADLVVPNDDDNVIVIPMTPGPGALTPGASVVLSEGADTDPAGVALGDVDGDGRLDVVTSSLITDAIRVHLNNTTFYGQFAPTFAAPTAAASTTANPGAVTLADVNRDGKVDVVAAAQNQGVVFLNSSTPGTVSFSSTTSVAGGGSPGGTTDTISAGDINGDGNTDFVITDGTFLTRLLLNTTPPGGGTPSVAPGTGIADPGQTKSRVVLVDVTADGRPDMVEAFNSDLRIRINTGVPLFTTALNPDTEFTPTGVAAGDVNGDDVADVGASNAGGTGSFAFFDVFQNIADIDVDPSVPATLNFGTQPMGTFGAQQLVPVANSGAAALPGPSTVTGAAGADYLLSRNSCGDAITPGESCEVGLRFGPTALGTRAGTLNFGLAPNPLTPTVGVTGEGGPLPQGPAGPAGPPGRDATVACKAKKKKKVKCTVAFTASSSSRRASATLTRRGVTFARGAAPVSEGAVRVPLRGAVSPGRYLLTVKVVSDTGKATLTRRVVVVS